MKKQTLLFFTPLLLLAAAAQGQVVFIGGAQSDSLGWEANWDNTFPSLANPGNIDKDALWNWRMNNLVNNWGVNHTEGAINLNGTNAVLQGGTIWSMSGGSFAASTNHDLRVENEATFNLSSGSVSVHALRVTGAESSFNQSGGSVIATNGFVGGLAGAAYNLSGGSFQTTSINYNSTVFNLSGGSLTLTALNTSANSDRIRLWTVSGNVTMTVTAASGIGVDRFNFANNWLPTATGATLTVSGWGQTEFEELFSTGRFQYDGENLNATQFAEIFQVSGSTLSIIPEPSTYAAIFGLMVLGLAAWRRRLTR
ncbi:MAG: PEP-CTERM sorting domain-containing protein [Opitutales bacterium]|nr:PEP-CTERM sorting domain-containing protein [Opitutales bacterium]